MELEVGEYIRTKSGKIYKIDKVEECSFCFEPLYVNVEKIRGIKFTNSYHIKDIKKHSKNIIDLIEVGDYINGQLIEKIYQKEKDKIFYEFLENKDGSYEVMEMCELKNIKSILTKEQFKEMEYKL